MKPLLFFSLFLIIIITTFVLPFAYSAGEGEEDPHPTEYANGFEPSPGPDPEMSNNNNNMDEDDGDSSDSSYSDSDRDRVLAPRRSYRKDPLHHFNMYTAGWNITNRHYWASVGYTGVLFFAIAAIWFATFGLCLSLFSICYCCRPNKAYCYGYSPIAYAFSLIFLILLAIAAIIGCIVLYTGEEKLESSSIESVEYVVNEADEICDTLRNVSAHLSAAKQTNVVQVSLSPTLQTDIDHLQTMIDTSASMLTTKTQLNARNINKLIHSLRLPLIIITALMLLLTLLGFVSSMLGTTFPVYILVTLGWILVTATFILCGIFLLLHNVTGDTCTAMSQWIQNPTPHTALDDILPCVDHDTVQQTLAKTKQVTSQLVDLINTVITNVSNINFASNFVQLYYNQSGPLLPTLCNPFHPDLSQRPCSPTEVHLDNATQVWSGSVCRASPSGICFTTGRLSPNLYSQFSDTVDVCNGLYQYSPFLIQLEDCSYPRQTFMDIHRDHCPGMEKYSKRVYVGLVMVATSVMLSIVLWVIYARERRHRRHAATSPNLTGFVYAKGDGHHGHDHGDDHN